MTVYRQLMEFNAQFGSSRQPAEWDMRALRLFARLKMPLPADDTHYRRALLKTCMRLHQVRTRRVGINNSKPYTRKSGEERTPSL